MIKQITFSTFCDAFRDMGRDENFSYAGKRALFDYLEEVSPDMELDVIALCCEYYESDIDSKGVLQAYKLIATKPGYFGDKRASTIVITKLETAVDGDWEVDVDPKRDIVSAARKTPFPQFIPPPEPTWIATSASAP